MERFEKCLSIWFKIYITIHFRILSSFVWQHSYSSFFLHPCKQRKRVDGRTHVQPLPACNCHPCPMVAPGSTSRKVHPSVRVTSLDNGCYQIFWTKQELICYAFDLWRHRNCACQHKLRRRRHSRERQCLGTDVFGGSQIVFIRPQQCVKDCF